MAVRIFDRLPGGRGVWSFWAKSTLPVPTSTRSSALAGGGATVVVVVDPLTGTA
jgi:hypothetical protein